MLISAPQFFLPLFWHLLRKDISSPLMEFHLGFYYSCVCPWLLMSSFKVLDQYGFFLHAPWFRWSLRQRYNCVPSRRFTGIYGLHWDFTGTFSLPKAMGSQKSASGAPPLSMPCQCHAISTYLVVVPNWSWPSSSSLHLICIGKWTLAPMFS